MIAVCPVGKVMLHGGGGWGVASSATPFDLRVYESSPAVATRNGAGDPIGSAAPSASSGAPDTWRVSGHNDSGAARTLRAYAVCVTAP